MGRCSEFAKTSATKCAGANLVQRNAALAPARNEAITNTRTEYDYRISGTPPRRKSARPNPVIT
jgi:hypothetical protein